MTESHSLHALILLVQNGDPAALHTIYERIRQRLYVHIMNRYGSMLTKEDVEDVIHNTFAKIPVYAHQYKGPNAQGWIYSIARHDALRMVDVAKKISFSFDDEQDENDENGNFFSVPEESSHMRDPDWEGDDTVENRALRSSVMSDIRKKARHLSSDEQRILKRRYEDDASYNQIGEDIGRSNVRAKQKHDSAISKLRSMIRLD